MNISYKQSQFELFPGGKNGSDQDPQDRSFFSSRITLKIENLVIFLIVGIMAVVFAFSLGVERGKNIALNPQDGEQAVEATVERKVPEKEEPRSVVTAKQEENTQSIAGVEVKAASMANVIKEVLPDIPVLIPQVQAGNYTLQVASFKAKSNAEQERDTLEEMGFEAFVLQKGDYSIVCVGRFEDKSGAKGYAPKIKSRYKDYLIRRL